MIELMCGHCWGTGYTLSLGDREVPCWECDHGRPHGEHQEWATVDKPRSYRRIYIFNTPWGQRSSERLPKWPKKKWRSKKEYEAEMSSDPAVLEIAHGIVLFQPGPQPVWFEEGFLGQAL